jgi:hypothetical protein
MASEQRPSTDRRNPWWVLGAAGAVVVAAPFAVWSWVGDQSSAGTDLDYMMRPPMLSSTQESIVLVASTLALVTGVVVLVAVQASGTARPPLLALTAIAAAYTGAVGLGYRIMTAGVIGANIGGGLVLLASVPATAGGRAPAAAALGIVLVLMDHRRAARETRPRLPGSHGAT